MTYKIPQHQPQFVFDKESYHDLEHELDELNAEFKVREIEVTFTGERYFFGNVNASADAFHFIRESILKGIEVQEHFVALYLNQANKIIGYYHHSTGTINSTPVDIEIVAAVALKTLAKAVIISHNHPSGNLKPSEPDKILTKRVKEALKLFDIALIDHIIVTREGYYSFADTGDRSLQGITPDSFSIQNQLRKEIFEQLKKVTEANAPNLFTMLGSSLGYKKVEEMVIRKVLHDQMIPAAAIPLIELELEMLLRVMDSYEHTPQYYRARIDVYREAIAAMKSDPDIGIVRNGVMRDKAHEQMLVEGKLREQEYPKTPLSFIELCTFNTWFTMHPEKVCGKEVITSSREFPLSIKGDRKWIENTISHATGEDRLILPVPFEWSLKYFEDDDPDFDVEYTSGKYTARIYQGGVDFNLQITEGDRLLENINFKHIAGANLHLMRFMQENRGTASSSTLELEALALEIELQISDL